MDLDGVIYNFFEEFRSHLINSRGAHPDRLTPAKSWEFYLDWGLTKEEYYDLLFEGIEKYDLLTAGKVMPGAIEGLKDLDEMNCEIVIVTARDIHPDLLPVITERTIEWLKNNDIPHHDLIIDSEKYKYDFDLLVDDALHNVSLAERHNKQAVVFDQPWNQHTLYNRVHSWGELSLRVAKMRGESDRQFAQTV